ncbi:MAG TPA: hypothetical protein VEJ87_08270, partial [Acidimicrobiales bacterium]|nr:hypothetical protein [Acidimicrobiales bacterium]
MTHQSAKPYDEKWSSRLRASAASFTLVSLGAVVYLVTSGNLHDSKWLLALAGLAAFVSATTFVLAGSISEWALRSQALLALGLGWMVISGTGAHLVDKGTSPAILLVLLPLIAGSLFFSP